jgi:hypothetical protein
MGRWGVPVLRRPDVIGALAGVYMESGSFPVRWVARRHWRERWA